MAHSRIELERVYAERAIAMHDDDLSSVRKRSRASSAASIASRAAFGSGLSAGSRAFLRSASAAIGNGRSPASTTWDCYSCSTAALSSSCIGTR